jgi:hypothetical protein
MKIGDLVRCRPRSKDENYDAWLGLIIGELPPSGEYKTVQWVSAEDGGESHRVNHKVKDLMVLNANR